jgi:3'-phosphoadenosine 5'-phosphosulfate sulfotransferase (PAPS reductase)/FAD synthetase
VEGYYWLDNQIIKAFDKQGDLHKIMRLKIDDNLNIISKQYKNNEIKLESWQETINRNKDIIDQREKESLELLSKYKDTDRLIIDTNSTGKDSMVKTHLAKKAGLKFDTYFNCTTMNVADSNIMAKNNKYKFTYPNKKYKSFYKWRERENIIPSRLNRCCCKYFKEDPTINSFDKKDKLLFLFGMRNDESTNRSGYTDIWVNEKWGKRDWIGLLPIRQWNDLEIWLYIIREGIEINYKYKKGYNRVGCGIVCPNYNKSTWVLDKYWYPSLYKRWKNILREDFLKNYKWISVHCTLEEYLQGAWAGGLLRPEPNEEVIKEFANYKDITEDIAIKYFDKYCINGCKNRRNKPLKIKDKDTLAMNLKMIGRNTEKFMCKKCLIEHLGINEEQWNKYIEEFKQQGCNLF